MSSHVKDGVLVRASPSSIDAFDDTTPFGCERRWHYSYVQGIREPESPSQNLGTSLHLAIDNYINGCLARVVKPAVRVVEPVQPVGALFLAIKPVVDSIIPDVVATEHNMQLNIDGVEINGRLDVETKTGVLDWKTTSDFKQYAKTPGQLRTATPMVLYGSWVHKRRKEAGTALPVYDLEHVYVQTKGRIFAERVSAKITPAMLDVGMERIISLVDRMKTAAGEKDVFKLKPDKSKCNRCPFQTRCAQENPNLMSLLNRFAPKTETAVAPPITKPDRPAAMSILPPDAPAVDMAKAAVPVPGFEIPTDTHSMEARPTSPEPAAPARTRGRPKGAKNLPKNESTAEILDKSPLFSKSTEPISVPDIEYKSITITHGATVPTVAYGNQRFDVSVSANFSGNLEAASAEVSRRVKELMIKELESVLPTLKP